MKSDLNEILRKLRVAMIETDKLKGNLITSKHGVQFMRPKSPSEEAFLYAVRQELGDEVAAEVERTPGADDDDAGIEGLGSRSSQKAGEVVEPDGFVGMSLKRGDRPTPHHGRPAITRQQAEKIADWALGRPAE